jgi:hypothetical protein
MYGITETTVHVTYRPLSAADAGAAVGGSAAAADGLGSRIGRPIPDLAVHLLDAAGNLVPAGVPGEIHVGGAGVGAGYLNQAALTAERFVPDPFAARPGERLYRSGDLARLRSGGDLEYLGRIDHQVKVRGFRIELGEIEAALARHPAVREAAVLARPDSAGDTSLVAYLVLATDGAAAAWSFPSQVGGTAVAPSSVVHELRQFLHASLPEHMIPAVYLALAQLPLTPHGKVDRRALPAPDPVSAAEPNGRVAPRTAAEGTLAAIWCEVLGVPGVGVRDDFFLLGGHSLSAARILARVRDALGAELSLAALFENPTIEGLAALLPGAVRGPAGAAPDDDPAWMPIAASAAAPLEQELAALYAEVGEATLAEKAAGMSDADLDALLVQMIAKGGRR